MVAEHPDLPDVEVLLNGRPLPRNQWERYSVNRSDLLDAMSGTRTTTYHCDGSVVIQRRPSKVAAAEAAWMDARRQPASDVTPCGSHQCIAGQRDGVLCADGECDRENGTRPDGVKGREK